MYYRVSSEEDDERFFGGKTNPSAFQRLVKGTLLLHCHTGKLVEDIM
jgi:hypothetical protein